MGKKRFTVTSALLYANGPIHLGHLAGAYLPADIYVRYQKLKGHDVAFICGSDEHGAAITLQAKKEGVSPQEIVDKYHELNKNSFKDFGINFDIYDRTSSQDHHETAQEVFKLLNDQGKFVKKTNQVRTADTNIDYETPYNSNKVTENKLINYLYSISFIRRLVVSMFPNSILKKINKSLFSIKETN